MASKQKSPKAVCRRMPKDRELENVQIAANSYCIRHFAIGYSGGAPRRLTLKGAHGLCRLSSPAQATAPSARWAS